MFLLSPVKLFPIALRCLLAQTHNVEDLRFDAKERQHANSSVQLIYSVRQNLTMRMSLRRFTRLTNAFSKKLEYHMAAIALHFMYYNFSRVHQSLRVTPAMEAGVTNHVWDVEEIVALLPETEAKKRGSYKKRISN